MVEFRGLLFVTVATPFRVIVGFIRVRFEILVESRIVLRVAPAAAGRRRGLFFFRTVVLFDDDCALFGSFIFHDCHLLPT